MREGGIFCEGGPMASHMIVLITVLMITSGCECFNGAPAPPIGYSKDENGRPCTTYQTESAGVYETVCDFGGQHPASGTNPLAK